jgi:hypothetical protein
VKTENVYDNGKLYIYIGNFCDIATLGNVCNIVTFGNVRHNAT